MVAGATTWEHRHERVGAGSPEGAQRRECPAGEDRCEPHIADRNLSMLIKGTPRSPSTPRWDGLQRSTPLARGTCRRTHRSDRTLRARPGPSRSRLMPAFRRARNAREIALGLTFRVRVGETPDERVSTAPRARALLRAGPPGRGTRCVLSSRHNRRAGSVSAVRVAWTRRRVWWSGVAVLSC